MLEVDLRRHKLDADGGSRSAGVMDDVVAQRGGQSLALGEDVADAILDDLHSAPEFALLGGRERLRERVRQDDVKVAAQVNQQRLVTQQRERALERAAFGGELHQRVGLGEVLVDDLGDGTGLAAEVADDLPVHPGDLRVEPVQARLPVGIRFGGKAADDIEDGMNARLADESPVAREGRDKVERFQGVRGKAVVLGTVVIAGADEPVVPEPLHAQGSSGAVENGPADEAKLVQVVVDLLMEAFGGDGALVAGERRSEGREHKRCPFTVEEAQDGLFEGATDALYAA